MTSFLRLFENDVRSGVRSTLKVSIVICVFLILLVLSFYMRIGDMALADGVSLGEELEQRGPFSSADYLAYMFAGKGPWLVDEGVPFRFPAAWMLQFGLFLYVTLRYPFKDLHGIGAQMLVAGQSRWSWWLSKCLWVAIWAIAFLATLAAIAFFWALLTGGSITWTPTERVEAVISQDPSLRPESVGSILPFFATVLWAGVGLSLLQLVLSLLLKPLLSFTACFSLLFVSACQCSPFLLGNYLIAMRSSALMVGGMNPAIGIMFGATMCVLSVFVGGATFSRIDLLDKEFDA